MKRGKGREKKRENVKREVKKERRGGRSRLHGDDL